MKIYIASSWKNQHAVELLTRELRRMGHKVVSWIENNYGEDHGPDKKMDFEEWVRTPAAQKSFDFDVYGAMRCDMFIYLGPAGKDAGAEAGIAFGWRQAAIKVGYSYPKMIALWAKGEDFGLMRKMFDCWFERISELLEEVKTYGFTIDREVDDLDEKEVMS